MDWSNIKRALSLGKGPTIFRAMERSRQGLGERLSQWFGQLGGLGSVLGKKPDAAMLEELESLLYGADLGPQIVPRLMADIAAMPAPITRDTVTQRWSDALLEILEKTRPLPPLSEGLQIIFLIGVNGVGKTTTTAKLALYYKEQLSRRVLLAAADTFRAAATEQLLVWSQRLGVECIHQSQGADPAAVVFDAVQAAISRQQDLLLIDTGGRLHTNQNLMESLQKMQRSAIKALERSALAANYPKPLQFLVLDATTGQNLQNQAMQFHQKMTVDALVVTKLDGTARGGALIAVCDALQIPIAFVGVGEASTDLTPFDRQAFVASLLA